MRGAGSLRALLAVGAAGAIVALLAGCTEEKKHRVVVLGIDGMDHRLTTRFIEEGKLPHLAALAAEGSFTALGTSIPPESPVAWSNFITGRNPGGHGVFDFIHKEWKEVEKDGVKRWELVPVDPIAGTEEVGMSLDLFGRTIPLTGGDQFNKRRGPALWDVLEEHDVPATLFRIPANFPPSPTDQSVVSGMGTPDLQGAYGTYFLYTDDTFSAGKDSKEKGEVIQVTNYDGTIRDFLIGPVDPLAKAPPPGKDPKRLTVPLRVDLDPTDPVARIRIGDEDTGTQLVLREGEWSDFVEVDFDVIPYLSGVTGIARFQLQQVRPAFRLFVDPINMSPAEPAQDISTPPEFAAELADACGLFETKGMPENTGALEEGVLTDDQYRQHALAVHERAKTLLFDMLPRYDSGLFFYYFSSVDLNSHMFWRCMDERHPGHDPETSPENRDFIEWLYRDVDRVVGEVRAQLDRDDTLIVMSDHGFAPWYRAFNLNTWLRDKGYLALKEPAPVKDGEESKDPAAMDYLAGVDWTRTRAYSLGFTCIYLNVKGRDPMGIVEPGEADALVREICDGLMREVDPENGEPIFRTMYRTADVYSGEAAADAPEIMTGFRRGYRNSNESAKGTTPAALIHDNLEKWSGCHLMAAEEVPGILVTNRAVRADEPMLYDLTPTILGEYGIAPAEGMVGRPLWSNLPARQ